uniref:Uncharacterized protein n=1 Tax=Triticum urartu TaxID=4572 RepID=A0A8R7UJI6_TRIUA
MLDYSVRRHRHHGIAQYIQLPHGTMPSAYRRY